MSEVIVHAKHLQGKPRLCIRGVKQWCARNGVSFMSFMRNGVPASQIESTGDSLAMIAVQRARDEAAAQQEGT